MLTTISLTEFAKRIADTVAVRRQAVTWFLGAGCSVTSGIPAAADLVQTWLSELHEMQEPGASNLTGWVASTFPEYRKARPARSYAAVFGRRHPTAAERQAEIEQVCARGEPAYGYATFAQLVTHPVIGRLCNIIMTTNFDDLIADAIYLYGDRQARPLIVTHDALTRFVKIHSPRPTIIKLHGDAHLDPRNLSGETSRIDDDVATRLHPFLQTAIVFIGYGGNDASVTNFLKNCPEPALSPPVYWVGKATPNPELLKWLVSRNALKVDHTDFDRLMHVLRGAFKIEQPSEDRWKRGYQRYFDQYKDFQKDISTDPADATREALSRATTDSANISDSESNLLIQIFMISERHPEKARQLFERALELHPRSARIMSDFAPFLSLDLKDYDAAEKYYKSAIRIDPNIPGLRTNYAAFLRDKRRDYRASKYQYQKALKHDSANEGALVGYADTLAVNGEFDEAEIFLKKSIEAFPHSGEILGSYGVFLKHRRGDLGSAEQMLKRAVELCPEDWNVRLNYSQVLLAQGYTAAGLAEVRQTLKRIPARNEYAPLKLEGYFYLFAHSVEDPGGVLQDIKVLLNSGVRSIGWDFRSDVQQANVLKHKNADLVSMIASVISGEAGIDQLNRDARWNEVKPSTPRGSKSTRRRSRAALGDRPSKSRRS